MANKVTVLDTTRHGGEIVVVLVDNESVYAENQFDEESMNCTYDAMFVANRLAGILGTDVDHVLVPKAQAELGVEEITDWYKGTVKTVTKKGRRR